MDRQFAYSGAIPLDTDLLSTNLDAYIGLSKLSAAILGTSTLLNGFTCTPTSPASLQVSISAGEIYSLQVIDPTAYGDLGADTTHSILKQGIILDSTLLTITPPGTVGYSQNYLVQFSFEQTDGDSVVLAYYNPFDPTDPYSGPNDSGASNPTVRQNNVLISAKAGVAATTGTQTTPSPDSGYVGGFVVTVANGQTTITSGNISTYSLAPLLTETLTQKISQSAADIRYAQKTQIQTNQFIYAADSSLVANTIVASLSPVITSYVEGLGIKVKVANTITGAATLNINGVGAVSIVDSYGNALIAGAIRAGQIVDLTYNGTSFELSFPVSTTFASNPTVIKTSGNFTVPAGVYKIFVKAWGAGGSGGGGVGAPISGGGGGAGAYVEGYVSVTPGAIYPVVIGTGGTAVSANTNAVGNAGTDTTFNTTTIVAKAGLGGNGSNGSSIAAGGAGGAAASCVGGFALSGGPGAATTANANIFNGTGGFSPNNTAPPTGNNPGTAFSGAANTGQGGQGGNSISQSGAGGTGLMVIYY